MRPDLSDLYEDARKAVRSGHAGENTSDGNTIASGSGVAESKCARRFHINRGRDIRGENILLLDDVYTTGATMHEAARELKRAGASSVMGLVMASGAD